MHMKRFITTFMTLLAAMTFYTEECAAQRAIRPNPIARQHLSSYIYWEKTDSTTDRTSTYYHLTQDYLVRQTANRFDTIHVNSNVSEEVKKRIEHTNLYLADYRYRTRRSLRMGRQKRGSWYLEAECGRTHTYVSQGDMDFWTDDKERLEDYADYRKAMADINRYLDTFFKN